jgi:hypothetical protein
MTRAAPQDPPATPAGRVRQRVGARRAREQAAEAAAQQQLDRDEAQLSATRAPRLSLGGAWRRFWRHPSPWILLLALLAGSTARLAVGGWHAADAWLPLVMLAAFPVVEWVIHVVVLHYKPVRVAGRTLDTRLARDHRAHHADPRDLPLVFIPWQTFLWLFPVLLAVALLAFDRTGLGLTWFAVLAAFGLAYEWTHYLIHSDYTPRSAAYRAVWRNHRLHHYKNENYWFTVTTSGTADRLLRTAPDPATVPTSPTARDLLGTGSAR